MSSVYSCWDHKRQFQSLLVRDLKIVKIFFEIKDNKSIKIISW